MIFLLDNYDSFTYNLYQYLVELNGTVQVARNDKISVAEVEKLSPDAIVISPGPKRPEDAGISVELVRKLGPKLPILGVCLGHQAIGHAFGAKVIGAKRIMHGKVSAIRHDGKTIFAGLENPFFATRYHSLAVEPFTLPPELEVSATADDGEVMGLRHRVYPIEGVQFHPESFLTSCGRALLENFVKMVKANV
ncbi:MAG TPA: aminodeoxychorismate/anthranilate synthase component II [candidate division Zixibacteria bacterium]|nr:aminodeoxychorismate/anthranilate synthase component II [candidate division Zixibacteria bacterium]